ncbi:hypothetical protein HED60_14580 [Planctomycetales bacterium ZRK34]|nr:hypothetical protein HED60_14580 [Planctomycetales bacterium ZRK34]
MSHSVLVKFVGGLVCLSVFSGCAFVDQDLELKYQAAGYVSGADGTVVLGEPQAPELMAKEDKLIIGTVKNTYGMKTADAVTDDSIPDWIAGAMASELEAAGFTVQRSDVASPQGQQVVVTRIIKVWVEQDPGFWTVGAITDLQLRIMLLRAGQTIKEFDVDSRGQGDRGLFGDDDVKEKSLRAALGVCLQKATPIIAETFSSKPVTIKPLPAADNKDKS